jgi:HEAT repeat protein
MTSSNIKDIIAVLVDSAQPLTSSGLGELSNRSEADREVLEQSWATIEPKRRQQIVSRLVELSEDDVELNFDEIFKYCLKDPEPEVRRRAIEGLWENEETSLITPLIYILEQDPSAEVQAAAATALGKFTTLAEHGKLRDTHMVAILKVLLTILADAARPTEVRRRALEAAGPLSQHEVKEAITWAYQGSDAKLKIGAIYAMGKNCDPDWLPVLLKELTSTDAEMRYEAASALGELGEETAVPHLIELIKDREVDVRLAAIQALGKIGGKEAEECLEQHLISSNEAIRQAAEDALEEMETWQDPLFVVSETFEVDDHRQ